MTLPTPTQLPESGVETRPIEVVTPIKPSEALRLGCLLYPEQSFGSWFDGNAACALGAMQAGFGGGTGLGTEWTDAYSEFRRSRVPVPSVGMWDGETASTGLVVMVLNDTEHWSRERIADWLEGLGL